MSESGRRDKEQGDESDVVEQSLGITWLRSKKRWAKLLPALCDKSSTSDGMLTTLTHKPSIVIEQATSSYSFRFSELSQPI